MLEQENLSGFENAWLAGFIDGEGYIGITFQRKKETKTQSASPQFHPYIIITNTNREVLEQISERIQHGHIYIKKATSRHKQSYQYKLSQREPLLHLLKEIKPYLKVKQKQCCLLIEFLNRRSKVKLVTGAGTRGTTSFNSDDERCRQELLLLNKRGI